MKAAYFGHTDCLASLILEGTNLAYFNEFTGKQAIHYAADGNQPEAIAMILKVRLEGGTSAIGTPGCVPSGWRFDFSGNQSFSHCIAAGLPYVAHCRPVLTRISCQGVTA